MEIVVKVIFVGIDNIHPFWLLFPYLLCDNASFGVYMLYFVCMGILLVIDILIESPCFLRLWLANVAFMH